MSPRRIEDRRRPPLHPETREKGHALTAATEHRGGGKALRLLIGGNKLQFCFYRSFSFIGGIDSIALRNVLMPLLRLVGARANKKGGRFHSRLSGRVLSFKLLREGQSR